MKLTNSILEKMIDEIDWSILTPMSKGAKKLPSDAIAIGFHPNNKKKSLVVDKVLIRFGEGILSELGWKQGDRIVVLNDPKNLMNFLIVKSETGNGYTLRKENPNSAHRIEVRWTHSLVLPNRSCEPVDYNVQNKRVVIFDVDKNRPV